MCGAVLSIIVLAGSVAQSAESEAFSWFRPLTWQESPEPGQTPTVAPPEVSKKLNIFKWTNEVPPPAGAPSATAVQQPGVNLAKAQPLHRIPTDSSDSSPVIATDGLQQPGSVNSASMGQTAATTNVNGGLRQTASYGQQSIDWPAENQQPQQTPATTTPSNSQGTNPFAWTNTGPAVPQSVAPPEQAPLVERSQQIWEWSNNPQAHSKPRELMPPDEPSFSSAVHSALSWSDQPPGTVPTTAESGRPPEDASDEELVEWEKQKYPWIRPFYWANNDQELGMQHEIAPPDPTQIEGQVPLLAKPFHWDNRHASQQPRPLTSPQGPRNSYPATQAAAYFQADEPLPNPVGPLRIPGPNDENEKLEPAEEKATELDGEEKGTLAEAESLGEAPEDNSLQFLRADTVLLKPGDFQFDYGFAYTKFDVTTPVIISTLSGNVVEHADVRLRELRVPFEVRYGLARRVQLFLNVPFGWVNSELSFPGFDNFKNDGGIGDVVFGGSFLLRENDPCNKPDAILTFGAVAPTGSDPFVAAAVNTAAPSLGNGVWSLASNLLFIKNYDPVVVFYGAGTRQSFDRDFNGQEIRLGGEYNYQFGVGFGVNSRVTFSTRFNGAYITETRIDGQRLPGTIQEPMTLGLAMTISKNKKLIEPFVDFGITDDASDARFGITWTR